MASNAELIQLKVFVDNEKKKVIFAEAYEDFVEILFSYFTLPLGTIARLSSRSRHAHDSHNLKLGSLTSLHESVVNLNDELFTNELCKEALVNPRISSHTFLEKLKVNLGDHTKPINAAVGGSRTRGDPLFLKNKASFIITDDLNVLPVLRNTGILILNSLGYENVDLLVQRTMYFGVKEFLRLLKWALLTNDPLTKLVLGGSNLCSGSCSCVCLFLCSCSSCIASSTMSNSSLNLKNTGLPQTAKLVVQKSKKKVLWAQVENFFVELLFSFLTTPLGAVIRLTNESSSPAVGINNLFNSISRLGDETYLKSEEVKTILLCPKLGANYLRVTNLLPIYELNAKAGHFLKTQATFVVSDDLEVMVSPSISTISALGIPLGDIAVLEVNVGEREALLLLKASLTSTSALTNSFNGFMKKMTDEP